MREQAKNHHEARLPYDGGVVMNIAGAMVAEVVHLGQRVSDELNPDPNATFRPRLSPGLKDVVHAVRENWAAQKWAEDISNRNVH